ncbi:MAG: hypothetical protein C0624_07305, partial [Desulfuromonas sp.]
MTHLNRSKLFMTLFATLLALVFASVTCAQDKIERQTFATKLGGSELVRTTHPFKRVTIADPKVADVVVLSPRDLYVYGKQV